MVAVPALVAEENHMCSQLSQVKVYVYDCTVFGPSDVPKPTHVESMKAASRVGRLKTSASDLFTVSKYCNSSGRS